MCFLFQVLQGWSASAKPSQYPVNYQHWHGPGQVTFSAVLIVKYWDVQSRTQQPQICNSMSQVMLLSNSPEYSINA